MTPSQVEVMAEEIYAALFDNVRAFPSRRTELPKIEAIIERHLIVPDEARVGLEEIDKLPDDSNWSDVAAALAWHNKTAAKAVKPVATSGDQVVEESRSLYATQTADARVKVEGLTAGETAKARVNDYAHKFSEDEIAKAADLIRSAAFDAGLAEAARLTCSYCRRPKEYTVAAEIEESQRYWHYLIADESVDTFKWPCSATAIRSRIGQSSVREAAEGWRDISSAPKNRKVIVGYFNELGKWRSVMATYYTEGTLESPDCDEEGFAPEGWYEESETHDEILPLYHRPTKWMPLPAAPEKEKA